ncbi:MULTISPECIES: FeoA family protein [Okeania]|uniref:Ferrous iron transport protein A n=1 Tax=Okeania hirsuta TaxID=1458930 RepID=A0A3N6PDH9_9CYAN|nr:MULTISPECIES: FeoA family protein [Okeania]NET14100.1 ferrous iron transport protein A [Okeania sp. SIO1H6]NES76557.1 ferrous iron transport protein A [Okeania sp. SIO1H4]NES89003.1 ferrous iron transport protein A [Okeania sp. SIO2B9]NET20252.1 ferrous iron transport protein A [Okeania sp. SIO1H5]NET78398.1 ferrous iron transport protein A [Okeania sp. SIO1F9]
MNVADLKTGQMAIVDRVLNIGRDQGIVERLAAMGVVSDRPVQVLREGTFSGPLHIRVGLSTEIAIRSHEAEMIVIKTDGDEETNSSEDYEMFPKSVIKLTKQVKTLSLLTLTAIVIVVLAEIYQLLNHGNIDGGDQQQTTANIVSNSTSQLTENEKLETVDTTLSAPKITGNLDAVTDKSDALETTNQATIENTINPVATTTNSDIENVESIGKRITDNKEIATLQQKLYTKIDKNWKKPVKQTAIYLVKVDKNGDIISYEAFNQIAKNHLSSTPLPNLVKPNSTNKIEWTEFAILLYADGSLEIEPK